MATAFRDVCLFRVAYRFETEPILILQLNLDIGFIKSLLASKLLRGCKLKGRESVGSGDGTSRILMHAVLAC